MEICLSSRGEVGKTDTDLVPGMHRICYRNHAIIRISINRDCMTAGCGIIQHNLDHNRSPAINVRLDVLERQGGNSICWISSVVMDSIQSRCEVSWLVASRRWIFLAITFRTVIDG